jgi:2'-5' RNA ligase
VNEPDHLRLFVAIPLPEAIKKVLEDLQRQLQHVIPNAAIRWTAPEQIHLTLRFFGSVAAEQLEELKVGLQGACTGTAAFCLQARGLGVFPDKRRPKVIWVGVDDDKGQLAALQRKIQTATTHFGEKPDERPFSAHLTLGRIKELRPPEAAALRQFLESADRPCHEWLVRDIELLRSELGPAGAKHSVISSYSLA